MDIIYFDTTYFIAHTDLKRERIELSEFLKLFPELHEFLLKHELNHAKIFADYGYSLRHIWLDYKDRFKLYKDPLLLEQLTSFLHLREPKKIKDYCFMLFYQIASYFSIFFALIRIWHTLKGLK